MGLVNAEDPAARGTGPLLLLGSDETSDAEVSDTREIPDHAHAVLGSITLVQVIQSVAGKGAAAATVPGFASRDHLTGLDSAHDPCLRFAGVVPTTAGTRVLVSRVSDAQATIHPTRRDQRRVDPIVLLGFRLRHMHKDDRDSRKVSTTSGPRRAA